jgi:hypothetical protein
MNWTAPEEPWDHGLNGCGWQARSRFTGTTAICLRPHGHPPPHKWSANLEFGSSPDGITPVYAPQAESVSADQVARLERLAEALRKAGGLAVTWSPWSPPARWEVLPPAPGPEVPPDAP